VGGNIVDAAAGGTMSAEARRRYAERFRSHPFQIQAVVFGVPAACSSSSLRC